MAGNLIEKRVSARLSLKTPVRYQIRGFPDFYYRVSDDISTGGLSFVNDTFIAPRVKIMLEINILSRVLYPVGRIAWASNLKSSNRYRLGVQFLELDAAQKDYLKDYINLQTGNL